MRNGSVHEESLSLSLLRLVNANFEDKFFQGGRNVALEPEARGKIIISRTRHVSCVTVSSRLFLFIVF